MKKTLKWAVAFALLAAFLCCGTALAAGSGTCGTNLTWTLSDAGVLTISGNGAMDDFIYQYIDDTKTTNAPWFGAAVKQIEIKNGVTSIGDYAFCYNSYLTSITIPSSVTSIGSSAFCDCTGLTSITIPDGVTSIGRSTFDGCTGLTSVTIPDSVTSIDNFAFFGCTGLTSVTIPDSVTSFGNYAFQDCTGLTSVTISDRVTSIGTAAFFGCTSLTSVTIPDSVTSIGSSAFGRCAGLTSVTIPDSVTSIGSSAFGGCAGLTRFTVSGGNQYYSSADGVLFNKNKTELIFYLASKTNTSYTIPDGVTSIVEFAFSDCTGLTSITIPDSVTSIGRQAFYGCTGLTSITIPDSVTSIGDYAFYGCTGIASFLVTGGNQYYSSVGGVLFDKNKTVLINYPSRMTGTSYTIPDGVTRICPYAFEDCTGLTSVTIPDSVTTIGASAFKDCTGLANVTIQGEIANILYNAFFGCTNLTRITLTEDVARIDWSILLTLTNLKSIWWPTLDEVSIPEASEFTDYQNITIYCHEFSPLETEAKNLGFKVALIENYDLQNDIQIIAPDALQASVGSSLQLPCTIYPLLPDVHIHYTSSNNTVGTVTDSGLFTAKSVGTTQITLTVNSVSKTFTVTVVEPATAITLDDVWVVTQMACPSSLQITPADATVSLTWTVGLTTYATVDDTGVVTGDTVGLTTLTVTDSISGLSATATVHTCHPVTAVAFEQQTTAVDKGSELALTAQVTMLHGETCQNHLVNFTSSNESVAKVDANGVVHGISNGVAQITATAMNDSSIASSVLVTVGEPAILTLPNALTTIESEAFAALSSVDIIIIPENVASIADDAFAGTGAVLSVAEGSYAAEWAEAHGAAYVTR